MNDRPTPSLLQRVKSWHPALLGTLVVVLAGLVWYSVHLVRSRNAAKGDYIFAAIEKGDIEDLVTATGTLQPLNYTDVGAQVSGQVQKLYVDVGDQVKANQPLVDIDATQSEARVDADRASLKSQQSQLVDRQNTLVKAQRDYERQQNLMKEDGTTLEQLQNAETTLTSAKQAIATLKAQIEQQQANMRVEETNLKFTKIVAPIDGTVVSISAKLGQTLNATQQAPTLLRIADLTTMTVQTQVSEADVAKLTKGMNAYFTTLGSQGRRWYGTLKRIEPTPTVQNSVVLYNALFDVQNDGGQLLPSMTAQVFFVRAEAHDVLVLPMAALQQGQQIARELAAKSKKKTDDKAVDGKPAAGAPPAAGNAATNTAQTPPAAGANAPGAAQGGAQGEEPAAGTPRRGFGGLNGGQPPTPEQIEQFRERMAQRRQAGGGGGFGPPGGGNFGQGGGTQRPAQQRRGTVMVKLADGTLEPRQVVVGVTDRVHGAILSGLKEGEEVVVGKREQEKPAATPANNQPNQQGNRPGNFGGGIPGGGFRPF